MTYALAGLAIFGGFTVVDFNRLRRAGQNAAVPIAASIFLDIFNVFMLLLSPARRSPQLTLRDERRLTSACAGSSRSGWSGALDRSSVHHRAPNRGHATASPGDRVAYDLAGRSRPGTALRSRTFARCAQDCFVEHKPECGEHR